MKRVCISSKRVTILWAVKLDKSLIGEVLSTRRLLKISGVGILIPKIGISGSGLKKMESGRDGMGFSIPIFSGWNGMGFFDPDFFGTGRD